MGVFVDIVLRCAVLKVCGRFGEKLIKNMISPAFRNLARPAVRPLVRRYGGGEAYKPITMNDLPVPKGSWQEAYNAKQKNYNTMLMLGVATFGGTLFAAYQSGLVVLNTTPDLKKMNIK